MSVSSTTTIRGAVRFVSPLLYVAGCASVLVVGLVLAFTPLPGGSRLFEHVVIAVIVVFLVCALLLTGIDLTLHKVERAWGPGLRDHTRHCALLYAGSAFVLVFLLTYPDLEAGVLQRDLGVAFCAFAAYGTLVEGVVVFLKRRFGGAQPGDAS